jgi:hypothetical protein
VFSVLCMVGDIRCANISQKRSFVYQLWPTEERTQLS